MPLAPRSRRPALCGFTDFWSGRFNRARITPIGDGYDPDFIPGYEVLLLSHLDLLKTGFGRRYLKGRLGI
jgi:hypothetical protein